MAQPLNDARIIRATDELIDPIQGIAASGGGIRGGCLRPFLNQGQGEPQISRNLLGAGGLEYLAEDLVGLHCLGHAAPDRQERKASDGQRLLLPESLPPF